MYIVYSGYLSPDSYTSYDEPVCTIRLFKNKEDVMQFRSVFEEQTRDPEIEKIIFRVFEGEERFLKAKIRITAWEFEDED